MTTLSVQVALSHKRLARPELGIKNKKACLCRLFYSLVPRVRLELTLPKEQDFESCASTNSATEALTARIYIIKALFEQVLMVKRTLLKLDRY